jgi:CDP-glucose 4,6-dehydratase
VKDVSRAYLRLAEGLDEQPIAGQAFNFSPEQAVSVLEMVARIQRLMGREDLQPVILDAAKGEIRSQYLDATKARQVLGWTPRYSLDEGLTETIAWYRRHLAAEREPDRELLAASVVG